MAKKVKMVEGKVELISEVKLNKDEKTAYRIALGVVKKELQKLLRGSNNSPIEKALSMELSDWKQTDVDIEKIESEVYGTLRKAVDKIK